MVLSRTNITMPPLQMVVIRVGEDSVMGQSITIRLTPTRERLLKLIKKRYNLKKNSDAIDLALKMSFKDEIDYKSKIERVAGCISLKGSENAVRKIRSLRDGE